MRKLAPFAALLVVVASVSMVGCKTPEPPKVVEQEAIDAGTAGSNAPAPPDKAAASGAGGASSSAPSKPSSGKARGPKAPPINLDSLTTSGKVTVPAGKVVIVDFWATWCKPCEKSFPKLQELYVKYKANGLEIAAVSVDDDKKGITEFAKTHGGAKFPIGWDDGKKVAGAYKPESMPTTIIVDKEGNIAHTHKGYHDGEMDEIEREIKALF
jgi:cytochrome c biogenesis protein CcmG/thiol:disulfide interchange protein DsbE